ncbi:uncharacterized protein ATC70_002486 [Mucor velutinosus]|uniref:SH3 domain-containing protein n=1 Tax=Mucor velutinosus TaxID=708070 RepID=A0AAN7HSV9_9FUNG|nr:hypothetical protein ATC70_002486 [Mucor velutinosus]
MKKSVATILLLFAASSIAQDDNLTCLSLKGSTTCGAFQSFYISTTGRYPFLANVTDVASFDAAMRSYVKSSDSYLSALGCANRAENLPTIPYARYSLTFMCATIIQDNYYSLPCNYQYNLSPPPLCQSTCFDYTASLQAITGNTEVCPNQREQHSQLENLNSSCVYWSGLNGTYNCIIGMANEPSNCGFGSVSQACGYCKSNGTDSCCETVSGCRSLSVGAIIGIIIGCLVFAGLVGAFVFWFCYKKNKKQKYNGFMMNSQNQKHELHDSSSALGYESLVSQQGFNNASQQKVMTPPPAISTTNLASPPPINTMSTNSVQPVLDEFFEVKHPYPPQMGDELGLHVGDIVCVAMNFDDGWALGFNVTTGLKGVFPVVCVAPAPEELLEQLLIPEQNATNKTLVEDGSPEHLNMQQICENLKRSMSQRTNASSLPTSELTQHSNIPRRTASIMRSTYDYRESDSPTSPTHHTPFFDVNMLHSNNSLSQPEPALFQPIETIEMHRKNNRVSKLEE